MTQRFMKTLYEWSARQPTGLCGEKPKMLSEDEQKWLLEALQAYFVDGATLLKICFNSLDNLDEQQQIYTFETIEDLVENIDNARILTPMKKWAVIIEFMHSQSEGVRAAAQKAAGAALSSCSEVIEEALACGIAKAIAVEKSCVAVVSALVKDERGCLALQPGILREFSKIPGCEQRVAFLNDLLKQKVAEEEVSAEVKQAWQYYIFE